MVLAAGEGLDYTATPSATPRTTGTPGALACNELKIVSGGGGIVPEKIKFETTFSGGTGKNVSYRYHFGDGAVEEGPATIEHTYTRAGEFATFVEVQDSNTKWRTSPGCTKTVTVKNIPFVPHSSQCTELAVLTGEEATAPATLTFRVSGSDSTGKLQGYVVEYGDETKDEKETNEFNHVYTKAGTYTVKGFVKDSEGKLVGGTSSCTKSLRILTQTMTKQPETGVSVWIWVMIGTAGISGIVLHRLAYVRARD